MFALYRTCRQPKVSRPAGFDEIRSPWSALDRIMEYYKPGLSFAITARGSDQVIGSISFCKAGESHISMDEHDMEMGYWLDPDYWGKGLMIEAGGTALDFIFNNNLAKNIWCVIQDTNTQSLRVQEKLGFRYNRQEEVPGLENSKRVPGRAYRISSDEWKEWRCSYERSASQGPGTG